MSDQNESPVNIREKVALRLILLAIRIVAPWKHDHTFRDMIKTIEAEIS